MASINESIDELKTLLPVIGEKVSKGEMLHNDLEKATSLIKWRDELGRSYTAKQETLIRQILYRAKRKIKGTVVVNQTADTEKLIQAVVERLGNTNVDTEAVAQTVLGRIDSKMQRKLVEDAVALLEQHRKVEIVVKSEATGKTKKVKGPTHAMFERLVRAATARVQGYAPGIFLQGEMSSGKTTGGRMLAEVLGLKLYFNGAISFPHEMLGFVDGNGKYHRTPFRDAYEHGGVYIFDEVDRSDPVALLAVNPHLANGVATFPDKQVTRHKDCIIICTANTWGLGADANYSGATKLDAAFLSRFPVKISWDIDPHLEESIITNAEWLQRVRAARVRAREFGLKISICVRTAQAGQALIEQGYSIDEAAEMTYLAALKPQQRQQLES